MRNNPLSLAIAAALVVVAGPALAEADWDDYWKQRGFKDRGSISLGGFHKDFTSEVAVSVGPLVGSIIVLESDLNLSDKTTDGRLDGYYRISRKKRLDFSYQYWNRDGEGVAERQLVIGDDLILDVGAQYAVDMKQRILKTAYHYSFVNTGKIDAGVSAGLSFWGFDLFVEGETTVTPELALQQTTQGEEHVDLLVPVPAFGLHVEYTVRPGLIFRASGEVFFLETEDWTAEYLDIFGALDWHPFRHVGFGLGIRQTGIRFTANDEEKRVAGDLSFNGLQGYISFTF